MIFTHNNMLFIFLIITHKKTQISDLHKQNTSWSLHNHEPFLVLFINKISVILKSSTKLKDINPEIKTKPEPSPGLPGTSSKNFQNSVPKSCPDCPKAVLKFSLDCLKIVPKIPKNSYTQSQKFGTEIFGLSRPLRKTPSHYMAFRLKIFQVGKFPTSWSLTKPLDLSTHA